MRKLIVSALTAAVLVIAPVINFLVPGVAHASGGTFTWSGGSNATAGLLGCTTGCWSVAGNWVGGTAPAAADTNDIIIIDNAATGASGTTDDVAGLSINNLEFTNNNGGGGAVMLNTGLTVDDAITQEASVTTTNDIIEGSTSAETLTFGGNVNVTANGTGFLTIGQTGGTPDTLALGTSNTVTFSTEGSGSSSGAIFLNANMTGTTDTVDYVGNGSTGGSSGYAFFFVNGINSYTATTNVQNGAEAITSNTHAFGPNSNTSVINVSSTGAIAFEYDASGTVNYTVNVAGQSSVDVNAVSLSFDNNNTATTTLNFPNIVLNGDATFANESTQTFPLTINLAGITVNNNSCVEYLGGLNNDTEAGANFENGPSFCIVSSGGGGGGGTTTPAPNTPNTGAALIEAHPALSLLGTIMLASGAYLVYRRVQSSSKRH